MSLPPIPAESTLRALNQALLLIAEEAPLEQILQRIVEAAAELADARYAALGVTDAGGQLSAFIHTGMSSAEVAALPHMPRGRGLLGSLIAEQRTIRLPNLQADPRSVGFPPGHPPMATFLGVPLIAHGEVVGNLYLTEKRGSAEFSAADQEVVEIFAAQAAVAVAKTHALEQARRHARQLAALTRASLAISSELKLDRVMQLVVETAAELVEARYAAMGVHNGETFSEFVYTGLQGDAAEAVDRLPQGAGLLGEVVRQRRPIRVTSLADDPRTVGFPGGHPAMRTFLGVPVVGGDLVLGSLYLCDKTDGSPFSADDQLIIEMLAANAAIAIQNARLYAQIEQLAVVSERNRIGMDLHDGVIQSIYAVGLTLESMRLTLDEESETQSLLDTAIWGLNGAIQDIRNFIMDLRPRRFKGDLREGIQQLVREFQANTLVPVQLHITARTESLKGLAARTFFLTTQEALANVARHARAKSVGVSLVEHAGQVILTVGDDGRGFDPDARSLRVGHGLANMEARARELHGSFQLRSAPRQGTTIRLSLPVE